MYFRATTVPLTMRRSIPCTSTTGIGGASKRQYLLSSMSTTTALMPSNTDASISTKYNRMASTTTRQFHETRRQFLSNNNSNNNNKSKLSAMSSASDSDRKFVLWDSLSASMKEVPLTATATTSNDVDANTTTASTTNTTNNTATTTKALAWYTCGPTTYSAMHLGHARTYVWLDMMRRVLESTAKARGAPPPLFVMNITDIDDKILAASIESSSSLSQQQQKQQSSSYQSPMAISRRAETNFWKDMDRLGCERPHITTRVTEFVDSDIVPYIDRLVQQGMAYATTDGVYFDVEAFEAKVGPDTKYGKLAGAAIQSSSDNSAQNNDDDNNEVSSTVTEKRDRRDFALWKARKEGEEVYWSSPWGKGRPGWHIECSAMIEAIQQRFQETHQFLVHAGGFDLKFPHHTNEIAQAEAYHHGDPNSNGGCCPCPLEHNETNKEWIPHWVHTGHLMIKDTKMSKSLKNFLTVDELWFDYDASSSSQLDSPADDFRLWCLMGGSYSHREEYSRSKILMARQNREKLLRFLLDGERWVQQCGRQSEKIDEDEDSDCDSDKRWSDHESSFFVAVNAASTDAHRALLNNMHGTKYAEKLLNIAEAGSAHIRQTKASGGVNVEPVKAALQSIRGLLSLVGFSGLTVRAGLQSASGDNDNDTPNASSINNYVVGGETAIVEELVRFRAAVRAAALADVKSKNGTDNVKAILKACDELRDALPAMGLEVMDSKKDEDSQWRFCVPTKQDKTL